MTEERRLTPQQELFCQKYLECKRNASEAYRQSYNCINSSQQTIWNESHVLMSNPYVTRRISQLFDIQAERLNVTMESLADEYEDIRVLAKKAGDYSPAISAITGKAKLFGLITDKSEIAGKDGKELIPEKIVVDVNLAVKELYQKTDNDY